MKPTNIRWGVIALLFFATTINYVARTNLSVALPVIGRQLSLSPTALGAISSAFVLSYWVMQIPVGPIIDKIGTRLTYTWSVILWSLVSMATAFANTFAGLYLIRLLLGVAESPAFPAATKTAADWIPRKQRGISTGIFTAGVNMGSAVALPLIAWLVTAVGWKNSFIVTGLLGFVWLAFWLVLYRDRAQNRRVNDAENALIDAGIDKPVEQSKVPWLHLFRRRSMWGLMIGYACQIYITYVFLTWLPTYLVKAHNLTLIQSGIYGMLPFIFGAIAAFCGGWLSDLWMRRTPYGRKLAMSIGLAFGVAVIPAAFVGSAGWALFFITIASIGTMFSNGAAWAMASEMAPIGQAGSVASLQNFGGNLGGFLAPTITGILFQVTNSFVSSLVVAGILAIIGAIFYLTLLPAIKLRDVPQGSKLAG